MKTVLITGGSSGIGKETALELNRLGYCVYAAARRIEKMKDLEDVGISILKMDVTDDRSVVAGIETITREQGGVDILINNAGYGSFGALEDVPIEEGKYQFEVNVFGLARLTQLVLPYMRRQKAGRIINISSVAGKISEPHGSWYHGTKFAVEGMSDCLRQEVKQFGIDVVVIQPGAIRTEWNTIAREKMLKTSGQTAYGELVKKHIEVFESYDSPAMSSTPDVIAAAIVKAVTTKSPKTRYHAGKMSGLTLLMRRILPDRMFDRFMMSFLK